LGSSAEVAVAADVVDTTTAYRSIGTPVRVAHLVSHPIQYFAPLYRELASRSEIDLTVLFCSDGSAGAYYDPGFGRSIEWGIPLLEGYGHVIASSAREAPLFRPPNSLPQSDILAALVRGRYDVLWAHGYVHQTILLGILLARATNMRTMIREEQNLLQSRPLLRRAEKQIALRLLFRGAIGLYIGKANKRYFQHYGMGDSSLFHTPYCVDNAFFRIQEAELARQRDSVRARFGITDDEPVVLYSGKLIEVKQPRLLLEAFNRVRRENRCWLLMVGDGHLRGELDALVRDQGVPNVVLAGFLSQAEVAAAYAAADVFVLPSAVEPWGLVVNEAMNFGLPLVVSNKVGCSEDLVRPGWNGLVFDHRNPDALADALLTLVSNTRLRIEFGNRSRRLIESYSVAVCADGIVRASLAAAG
jgi:glycosyltransferase involved in cell wall biosynthesis